MNAQQFLFKAPSGNETVISIVSVENRFACEYMWRDCPPEAEDMRAAALVAELIIGSQTGGRTFVVDSQFFEDEEEMRREQRAFLEKAVSGHDGAGGG